MPPDFIRFPASIKNGIAIKGNESNPLKHAVAIVVREIFVVATIVTIVAIPNETAIGAPISKRINIKPKSITIFVITVAHLLLLCLVERHISNHDSNSAINETALKSYR